ncbi:hypothetical protein HS048_10885 [Planomonospora sp. ID91781]|uniref:hypothetical protein n=1 Tax=Planomonospora sp. ID91781 TaxID=2738135 RepID=UPI0018C400AD|nr:hypothetical protein [Planomonospora sp. ID91781]MBG0821239.1 hypothetical protein [Planomonospora sp. ID91781]
MREHRGVSREELQQSALVAVAVLLVLGVVAAWSVLIPGVSAWENLIVALIGSLRITGPVAAAFAAWVAVRRRRAAGGRALTTWQAVRAPLAILVVVMGSYTATVLVLAVKTMLSEQAGRLLPSGLIMGVSGLALYVTIGWVTGWLLPWTITPALAGLGCYALFSWLADGSTWADRLAPATREPYDLFQGLSAAAFTDQTLWLLGVSAALLLGWAAIVTRQALVLAAALLAVLAAGTGVARLLSEPKPIAIQRVVYSCQEWPIMVCVHPGMRTGLDELGSAFVKIASRLAGTPGEFSRVEQRPRRDDAVLPPGVVPVHVDDLSAGFADRAADEFVEGLAEECEGTVADGYRDIVTAWLRGEPLPGGPLPEHQYAAAWFSGLTEAQRRGWLRLYYSDFTGCRLQSTHFGAQTAQSEQTRRSQQETPEPRETGSRQSPGTRRTGEPKGRGGSARERAGDGTSGLGRTGLAEGAPRAGQLYQAPEDVLFARPAVSPAPEAPAPPRGRRGPAPEDGPSGDRPRHEGPGNGESRGRGDGGPRDHHGGRSRQPAGGGTGDRRGGEPHRADGSPLGSVRDALRWRLRDAASGHLPRR